MEKPRSPKFRHHLQTMACQLAPRTAVPRDYTRRLERSVPPKKASESGTTILPGGRMHALSALRFDILFSPSRHLVGPSSTIAALVAHFPDFSLFLAACRLRLGRGGVIGGRAFISRV